MRSPDCGKGIDRGLGHACGGGVAGSVENCGLFFCEDHRAFFIDNGDEGGESVCERCAKGEEAFDPSPDTPEWARHVLTDESWAKWREEYPERARRLARLAQAIQSVGADRG